MELSTKQSQMGYPLTGGMTAAIVLSYFLLFFIPESVIKKYFFSYPGSFNFVNWILSTFFHASFFHLFWNALFLFILGRAVEEKVGMGKWILFYTMAGLLSGLGDSFVRGVILSETNPTVGASGAISGIAIVAALQSPYTIPFGGKNIPFPVFLIAWLMIYSDFTNLYSRDNIAHWSHIGGYFSVLVTAYFLSEKDRNQLKMGFFLNLLFFTLSMIILYFYRNR